MVKFLQYFVFFISSHPLCVNKWQKNSFKLDSCISSNIMNKSLSFSIVANFGIPISKFLMFLSLFVFLFFIFYLFYFFLILFFYFLLFLFFLFYFFCFIFFIFLFFYFFIFIFYFYICPKMKIRSYFFVFFVQHFSISKLSNDQVDIWPKVFGNICKPNYNYQSRFLEET